MFRVIFLVAIFFSTACSVTNLSALERHIHAGAGGTSPQELPLLVAK